MLFLTNEHVQSVLDMPACMAAIEDAYVELAEQRAGYRPRIDFYVPDEPHYYRWGTMEGASRQQEIFAIRMKSDKLVWESEGDFQTEDKYCVAPGTYCGLIFLFSTKDARPLALLNDGYLQHMRVGACAGLGAKYLSRSDSHVLAMIGSGGMARTYASAIKNVRSITEVRVFSPTKENRETYAAEMSRELAIDVKAYDRPEAAIRGADIVALATDSLIPVMDAKWVEPGMHITNVRGNEAGPDLLERVDVLARLGTSTLPRGETSNEVIAGSDGMTAYIAGSQHETKRIPLSPLKAIDNDTIGTIPDLMAGKWPGRTGAEQVTFLNNQGTQGLQFAAIGAMAYRDAVKRGIGHRMPDEWFLQNIRD